VYNYGFLLVQIPYAYEENPMFRKQVSNSPLREFLHEIKTKLPSLPNPSLIRKPKLNAIHALEQSD
jgi:hypothetical protein